MFGKTSNRFVLLTPTSGSKCISTVHTPRVIRLIGQISGFISNRGRRHWAVICRSLQE